LRAREDAVDSIYLPAGSSETQVRGEYYASKYLCRKLTNHIPIVRQEFDSPVFTSALFYYELLVTVDDKQVRDPFLYQPDDDDPSAVG
jgi:hypothetical protein